MPRSKQFRPTGRYGPLAGAVCICPPGCTDKIWGDGKRVCETDCVPCSKMKGQPYFPLSGKRAGK